MTDARCPVFIRLGNRGRDLEKPVPGKVRDVIVQGVAASGALWPCAVVGVPGHPVEGVTFSDVRIAFKGGGSREDGRVEVPEHVAKYPSADMFPAYPAYGFYGRHARDLRLSGVRFRCEAPDPRPAVVCEDVARLTVDGLEAPAAAGGDATLTFRGVRGAIVRGCVPAEGARVFLKVAGAGSERVSLLGNDFAGVERVVDYVDGATPGGVTEVGNRT
jgi:hypothetical protein